MTPSFQTRGHDEEPAGAVRAEALGSDQLDPGATVAGEQVERLAQTLLPWASGPLTLGAVLQGCGFGYRYTRLPHLLKTKPEDANLPSLQSRCCQQGALPRLLFCFCSLC